ncbi:hypothetical protein CPAV1605_1221 [seawater metagenome]|uniref:Uncharacterized protein n=1 Tax=seawater metagenome TaxID=1561972 RepID=A0A5E8CMH7_9ZZZZ
MQKKNLENIILVVLVVLLLLQQIIYTISDFNIFDKLSKFIVIKGRYIEFVLIIVITILGLIIRNKNKNMNVRDKCEFPLPILENKIPINSNVKMNFKVTPFKKVVYWTISPLENIAEKESINQINKYNNAGVVKADEAGNVNIWFRNPELSEMGEIDPNNLFLYIRVEEDVGILGPVTKIAYKAS